MRVKDGHLAVLMNLRSAVPESVEECRVVIWKILSNDTWTVEFDQTINYNQYLYLNETCHPHMVDFDVAADVFVVSGKCEVNCGISVHRLSTGEKTHEFMDKCVVQDENDSGQTTERYEVCTSNGLWIDLGKGEDNCDARTGRCDSSSTSGNHAA